MESGQARKDAAERAMSPLKKGQKLNLTPEQREARRRRFVAVKKKRWKNTPPDRWIMSFSGGKDSTAMLHVILRENLQLDDVITFASDWDFPGLEAHLSQVERNTGITITRIRPKVEWYERVLNEGWPKMWDRWCTGNKGRTIDKVTRGCGKYIGIAADEAHRADAYRGSASQAKWARFPLIDYEITTKDAMQMCRDIGYRWDADATRPGLYEVFKRFSCYNCPLQSEESLNNVRTLYPDLWAKMLDTEQRMSPEVRAFGFKKKGKEMWTLGQWDVYLDENGPWVKKVPILDIPRLGSSSDVPSTSPSREIEVKNIDIALLP